MIGTFVMKELEDVYMRPEVNSNRSEFRTRLHDTRKKSNRFEISDRFEISFRLHGNLHGDFTMATFQTILRLYCTCANDIF